MPLAHRSKIFAVEDAKLAKITADPAGGVTTLATSIDIPGIKAITVEGNLNVKSLRGDNTELDVNVSLNNVAASLSMAKMDLDLFATFLGGTVADTGTTPNQKATWAVGQTLTFSPFQVKAQTPVNGVDFIGGAATIVLYRCTLADLPQFGFAEEDYRTVTIPIRCVPRISDGKRWDVYFEETQTALT